MDGHAVIKLRLGSAHLDRNAKALEHLVAVATEQVDTNHLLLRTSADELVSGWLLVIEHGEVHVDKLGLVNLDVGVTKLSAGLVLGQTNRTRGGVREDGSRHIGVLELAVLELLATKETVGETTASRNGDRGEFIVTARITKRIHAGGTCVLVLVNDDVALVVRLDLSGLEVKFLDVRGTTDGPQHAFDLERGRLTLRLVLNADLIAVARERLHLGVIGKVDAVVFHLAAQVIADDGVKVAEDVLGARKDGGLGAERVEDAGQLDADVTGADHSHAFGLLLQIKEAIRVNAELGARYGWDDRVTACDKTGHFLSSITMHPVISYLWQ